MIHYEATEKYQIIKYFLKFLGERKGVFDLKTRILTMDRKNFAFFQFSYQHSVSLNRLNK